MFTVDKTGDQPRNLRKRLCFEISVKVRRGNKMGHQTRIVIELGKRRQWIPFSGSGRLGADIVIPRDIGVLKQLDHGRKRKHVRFNTVLPEGIEDEPAGLGGYRVKMIWLAWSH